MDNIDKRIELLHKVQEEMDRRGKIQEEADRLHMAGDFQKEGEEPDEHEVCDVFGRH